MKKSDHLSLVNRIAVILLLLASCFYHLQESIKERQENHNLGESGSNASRSVDSKQRLPSASLQVFLLPSENLINNKPI